MPMNLWGQSLLSRETQLGKDAVTTWKLCKQLLENQRGLSSKPNLDNSWTWLRAHFLTRKQFSDSSNVSLGTLYDRYFDVIHEIGTF